MLKHYFISSVRSLCNDKMFASFNVVGLTLALASFLFFAFWVDLELSYETEFSNMDRIYQVLKVEQRETGAFTTQTIRPGIATMLKNTFPEISVSTFVNRHEGTYTKGTDTTSPGVYCKQITTSTDFLRMFDFYYLEGSPTAVLETSNCCIITDEIAERFFGKESPINKTLSFAKVLSFRIVAVVKKPKRTHLNFDILSIDNQRVQNYGEHYIQLAENSNNTENFRNKVGQFLIEHNENSTDKLILLPLKDTHLHMPSEAKDNSYGSLSLVVLYCITSLLILAIAVIGYVNMSISRSMNKLKEIGVLRAFGARTSQLVTRFLLESCALSLIATIFALIIVKLGYPFFSRIMGQEILLEITSKSILFTVLIGILVGLLSGAYSAFYLSTLGIVDVFRGGTSTGSQERTRKMLIGIQVFLSLSIILITSLIYRQIQMMYNMDGGINKENIIILRTNIWYDSQSFINRIINENSNILSASMASEPPYNAKWGYSGVEWEGSSGLAKKIGFTQISCDVQYADVFGLQLILGKFLDSTPTGNIPGTFNVSFDVVINETLWRIMNVENPIGRWIKYGAVDGYKVEGKIIGVIKDFNFKPLTEPIAPLILALGIENRNTLFIKTTGSKPKETLNYILDKYEKNKWNVFNDPTVYGFIKDDYDVMYASELNTVNVLTIFTLISLILSLFGIISLISFMIEKRAKEIAIRRVNGAKVKDIVIIFAKELVFICAIASAIAIPICYILVKQWQETYIFQASLPWYFFVGIAVLLTLLILIVVSLQIVYTAQLNPTKNLKNE